MKNIVFLAGEKIVSLSAGPMLLAFAEVKGGLSTELSTASVDCPAQNVPLIGAVCRGENAYNPFPRFAPAC